ncbi:unnamed protein product [Effrenium voratum]|nr:unnamed protein product [Effrenium voratum]
MVLDHPTRCSPGGSPLERLIGFFAASVFSVTYVAAPLHVAFAVCCTLRSPFWWGAWALNFPLVVSFLIPRRTVEWLGHIILTSPPMRQIPKYFDYEEYHEISDSELRSSSKKFIVGAHPHGVFSFVGVCAAVSTHVAPDGFGASLPSEAPTAAASVIKLFPILKDVIGMFGVIDASSSTLAKRLTRGSFVLYIGGLIELFYSSPKQEVVFLKQRKGFIKLALRAGADVIPVYMFGNTTVLSVLAWGPLASLSRSLGMSATWRKLTYVRGRPLGMPHIENPSPEDIEKWHAIYCEKLKELFDSYKGRNPDYKEKELMIQ